MHSRPFLALVSAVLAASIGFGWPSGVGAVALPVRERSAQESGAAQPLEISVTLDRGAEATYEPFELMTVCRTVSRAVTIRETEIGPQGQVGWSEFTVPQGESCGQQSVLPPSGQHILRVEALEGGEVVALVEVPFRVAPAVPTQAEVQGWLTIDRGAGATYNAGEPMIVCLAATRYAEGRLVEILPDGVKRPRFLGGALTPGEMCLTEPVRAPGGSRILRLEVLDGDNVVAQTEVAFQVVGAQRPELIAGARNCDSDLDCLISSARTCEPARAVPTFRPLPGFPVQTGPLMQTRPAEPGSCYLDLDYREYRLEVTDEMVRELLAQGMSQTEVEGMRRAVAESAEWLRADFATCKFPVNELVALLDRWKAGMLSSTDLPAPRCEGTLQFSAP